MNLGVKFIPPKLVEVIDYGFLMNPQLPTHECEKFHAYYSSNGWKVGRNPMKSWRDALVHWRLVWQEKSRNATKPRTMFELKTILEAKRQMADSLKKGSSYEVATGRKWRTKEDQVKYADLMRDIDQLNQQLSQM